VTRDPSTTEQLREELEARTDLPAHVAIIMDGNGRWAQQRGLERVAGHEEGVRAVRRTVEAASGIGLEVLSLFVFSQENWKRPLGEVHSLMNLLSETIDREVEDLDANNVQLRITGDLSEILPEPRAGLQRALERTRDNRGLVLNLALNYGGRREILRAAQALLARRFATGQTGPVTAEEFESHLQTRGLPDPDLLIRTSGEQRLSNFLLWQIAYSEIVFPDVLWPDFDADHFYRALGEYLRRERRFGRTSAQVNR